MKKNLLAGILAAGLAAAALSGCGKEEVSETGKESAVAQEEAGAEEASEEATEQESEAEAVEEAEQETESEEEALSGQKSDWLSEQGLSITPQGEFSFSYSVMRFKEFSDESILGKEESTGSVEITETVKDGYKIVEAVFTLDVSGLGNYPEFEEVGIDMLAGEAVYPAIPLFCFDRYTGTDLGRIAAEVAVLERLEPAQIKENVDYYGGCAGYFVVKDVQGWTQKLEDPLVLQITLYCPEDYDGAVFAIQDLTDETLEIREGLHELCTAMYFPSSTLIPPIGSRKDVGPAVCEDSIFYSASDQ